MARPNDPDHELAALVAMDEQGFVTGDVADDVIRDMNLAAAAVGAPYAFEKIQGGYRMHPQLLELFRANPGLLEGLAG